MHLPAPSGSVTQRRAVCRTHRLPLSIVGLLGIVALSGCGSTHQDDVRQASGDFQRAVGDHDWTQACARLSPLTREELVESAGTRCDEALAEEQLPRAGRIDDVAVFGTNAQVRYEGETLFLARFDDTWRVVAAGCTAQRPKPYDCQLQGG